MKRADYLRQLKIHRIKDRKTAQDDYWESLISGLEPHPTSHLSKDEFYATRLKIKDKKSRLIPFVMNDAQYDFSQKRVFRDIVVKPRQIGFSTLFQAEIAEPVVRGNGVNSVTIGDTSENTTTLVEIFDRLLEHLPDGERPFRRGRYPHGIKFPDRDSLVYLGTAGGKRRWGHGKTVHKVHASEVGFWPDAKMTMDALEESVPTDPYLTYTSVVMESTPNGAGGYFFEQVQKALRGDSAYKVHFYTWWWVDEYTLPVEPKEIKYTTEEQELITRVSKEEDRKLTPGQIKWRRDKIRAREDVFWQEYPEDLITCFLTSGRPRFNQTKLHERINTQCQEPIYEALPVNNMGNTLYQLRVYENPITGHDYVIGADAAEGIQVTSDGSTDFATAVVRDRRTNVQVATLQGRFEPFEFALLLYKLGRYYNYALIGVERNNHGHAVLGHLLHGTADGSIQTYQNLYAHYDDNRLGWPTTSKTRPLMISDLAMEYASPKSYIIRDKAIIGEAMTFVILANGRPEASMGAFDDLVFADAIACQLRIVPHDETEVRYEPVEIGDF